MTACTQEGREEENGQTRGSIDANQEEERGREGVRVRVREREREREGWG
jgi:hypothetical protein